MKIHSKNITAYTDFLISSGYTITLHGDYINNSAFLKYNFHQNPYCHYVKTVYGKWNECICRQDKIKKKSCDGAFFGCCYAGVGEYVYPVRHGNDVICFISVSGYLSGLSDCKAEHFAKKYGIDLSELNQLKTKYLKAEVPSKADTDAVIMPLVFMLEAYFERKYEGAGEEALLYHKMLKYIGENCHSKITMKQLSQHFHYSVSTLSHLFYKNSGKSLPAYIEGLRMNEAKWYLINSIASITEIAMFLGYSSSNYFASVFKEKNGLTPNEYRAKMKKIT